MKRATATLTLRAKHQRAFARPELRLASDGIPRVASTGAISAPIKQQNDPATQAAIEEYERRRRREPNTILGGG